MSKKGYHIAKLPEDAKRMARAGAILEAVGIGDWVGSAIREKWARQRKASLKIQIPLPEDGNGKHAGAFVEVH